MTQKIFFLNMTFIAVDLTKMKLLILQDLDDLNDYHNIE